MAEDHPSTKTCKRCKIKKPVDEFRRRGASRNYAPIATCKACEAAPNTAEWRAANPLSEVPEGQKWCRRCEQYCPREDFDAEPRHKDGLKSYCRECCRQVSQAWKEQNREHTREYAREYAKGHPEQMRENDRRRNARNPGRNTQQAKQWAKDNPERNAELKKAWKDANPEKVKATNVKVAEANRAKPVSTEPKQCGACGETKEAAAFYVEPQRKGGLSSFCIECMCQKSREWVQENPERAKASRAKYYVDNKDRLQAIGAIWRKENPEKQRELSAAWRKANPEKYSIMSRLHCAKRRAATKESVSIEAINEIGRLQKWRCAVCSINIKNAYHVDHIKPLSKGGSHTRKNLQLLCPPCNHSKHAKDPIEFMRSLGRLL